MELLRLDLDVVDHLVIDVTAGLPILAQQVEVVALPADVAHHRRHAEPDQRPAQTIARDQVVLGVDLGEPAVRRHLRIGRTGHDAREPAVHAQREHPVGSRQPGVERASNSARGSARDAHPALEAKPGHRRERHSNVVELDRRRRRAE
jgi:hypothetical protein